MEELLKKGRGLIRDDEVDKQRSTVASLEARGKLYPIILTELTNQLTAAQTRLQAVTETNTDGGSHNSSEEFRELDLLKERKKNMDLRAVHSGGVHRIDKEPGEIINAGEAVVKIVAEPTEIIGFLPQEKIGVLSQGDTVWISATSDRHKAYESKVIAISPRITNTPDRASPLPNRMLHGREVVIGMPKIGLFLPGQTVIIHLKKPGRLPFIGSFYGGTQ